MACFAVAIAFVLPAVLFAFQNDGSLTDTVSLVRDERFSARFPESSSVVLLSQKFIAVDQRGNRQTDIHLIIRLKDETGIRRFGDMRLDYLDDRESITVLLAQTITRTNRLIPVEKKAINHISRPDLVNTPAYLNHKQVVVSFPALEPGVAIELKLRKTRKESKSNPHLWGTEIFQATEPVLRTVLSIKVPASQQMRFQAENGLGDPAVRTQGGFHLYRWEREQSPPLVIEPHMQPVSSLAPVLRYSTLPSWDAVGRRIQSHFKPRGELSGTVSTRVQQITDSLSDDETKIQNLFFDLSSNIRTVNLPFDSTINMPLSAEQVLKNGYGTKLHKAVLLATMLEIAGFRSDPLLVASRRYVSGKQLPAFDRFDNVYLRVHRPGGKFLYLNPAAGFCRYGTSPSLVDYSGFVLGGDGFYFIRQKGPAEDKNRLSVSVDLKLENSGDGHGVLEFRHNGYFDCSVRRFRHRTINELKPLFRRIAGSLGEGTEPTTVSISDLADRLNPAEMSVGFKSPEMALVQGDFMILHLAALLHQYIPLSVAAEHLKHDLRPPFAFSVDLTGRIKLPPGYDIFRLPKGLEQRGGFGLFSVTFSPDPEEHAVTYRFKMTVNADPIPVSDYADFRLGFSQFKSRKNRLLLLRKK